MISTASARSALQRMHVRLLAGAAVLAMAGLAAVVTHPAWWPISVATLLAIPLVFLLSKRHGGVLVGVRATDARMRRHLERLVSDGFQALDGVEVGRERIDHVVAGPTGIYAIRTDATPGNVELGKDGWLRRDRNEIGELVWQATREAMALRARLREAGVNVPVQGIVALTAATMSKGPVDMGKALFLEVADVVPFIRSRKASLSAEQVDRVTGAVAGDSPRHRHPSGRAR